jgi:hypothetical protein
LASLPAFQTLALPLIFCVFLDQSCAGWKNRWKSEKKTTDARAELSGDDSGDRRNDAAKEEP